MFEKVIEHDIMPSLPIALFYYANQSKSQEKAQYRLGNICITHHHIDGSTLSTDSIPIE